MKRLLCGALLALVSLNAMSAGNDLFVNQRNPENTATLTRPVTVSDSDGLVGYAFTPAIPGNRVPVMLSLGAGLALNGSVLSASPAGAVTWNSVTGKPTFAAVATSGAYTDLSGRPTIPAAQVQTDWNATTGLGVLLNKPALFSGAYSALTGIPSTFAPAAHTQAWSTVTATPTTLVGYGITDGLTASALAPYATSASVAASLATKFNTPAGTTAQYVRGDGLLATLPTGKRIETYAGVTDANGLYTVTYPTAFPAVPNVQPGPPSDSTQSWVLVSSTASGFSVRLVQRSVLTVLSLQVLAGVVSNVAAAPAQVLVVAQ